MKFNIFLIGLTFIIISIVITLNIFFQQNYQQEMAEQFNQQQLLIAKAVSSSIKSNFEHVKTELDSFSRLLARRGLEQKGLATFVHDAFAEESIKQGIMLRIFGKNGELIYPERLNRRPDEQEKQMFGMAAEMNPGEVYYFNRIIDEKKVKMLAPVKNGKKLLGMVIAEILIDDLNKRFIAPIKSGQRGYGWMMDGTGTLIYHPTRPDMIGKNIYNADESCFKCHTSFKTESMILASPDVGFSSYVSPKGEDKLLAFSRLSISHMSWIVCVSIPYSEVTMSIQKSMRFHSMLILSIFSMTVIGAFIIIISNRSRIKAEEKARHLEKQKALEHEIIHAKNYLENILESTQTMIMVLGNDFTIRTVNTAFEKMFRISKADVLNRDFFSVFPFSGPEDTKLFEERIKGAIKGQIRVFSDYPVTSRAVLKKMNIVFSPLNLREQVSGVILSCSDITEEANLKERIRDYAHELEEIVKARTRELMIEKEKLNAIVESIEAGICIFDSEKNLTWTNRVMKKWLSEEKKSNLKLDELYTGRYSMDSLKHAIVDNRFVQEVVFNDFGRRKGYFQVVSTPLLSPEGKSHILVLIQDVTDIKMAEEQMMQSEKLSALARLSAGVSHEIGNPLTSISSYVQILKEMDFDDFTREALETISRHINRIATIVRQMSSFTKTKQEKVEMQNVREIIDSTLQLVKFDKRMKDIRINEEIAPDLPEIRVNGDQLEQVLLNIVLNAADAMPYGGELTIRAFRNQNTIDIELIDTGKGIPDDHIEKIFDPFFTTKEKGTGLGLSVSYTIVRSFGGTILVSSVPEKGTIFTVRLPAHER